MSTFTKINIRSIVEHHFKTLVNDNSKKSEFDDWLTFLILPVVISAGVWFVKPSIDSNVVNIVITTLSIFVGLLINVIVLMFDIIKRDAEKNVKNSVLKQTLANISYAILLSIITIVFSLLSFIENNYVNTVATAIVYFLLTHFLITLLMIVKRMYALFTNEIEEIEKKIKP